MLTPTNLRFAVIFALELSESRITRVIRTGDWEQAGMSDLDHGEDIVEVSSGSQGGWGESSWMVVWSSA
jgi:hypothetical protein